MIKKVKAGVGRWVAGTKSRWSGLKSVDPVNVRQKSIPAPLRKRKRPRFKKM